jgi:hypothetical protein
VDPELPVAIEYRAGPGAAVHPGGVALGPILTDIRSVLDTPPPPTNTDALGK